MSDDEKKDFCKDGICMANARQESECKNFKPYENHVCRYPNICSRQGIGHTCEADK